MSYAVAFRFKGAEYYAELTTEVSFGTHKTDQIQIPGTSEHMLVITMNGGRVSVSAKLPLRLPAEGLTLNQIENLSENPQARLYISRVCGKDPQKISLPYNGKVTCGRAKDNDIILTYPIVSSHHFHFLCENGSVHVEDLDSTNHLYLNGKMIRKALMKSGDVLSIYTFRFRLINGELHFENMGSALGVQDILSSPPVGSASNINNGGEDVRKGSSHQTPEGSSKGTPDPSLYLTYHPSPRIREQMPTEGIILSSAPGQLHASGGQRGNMAFLLGSGAMMAASLASGIMSPAMLLMRVAGMISPAANILMSKKMSSEEKQQLEEYEKLRQESYTAYINDQKARIKKVADVQRRILETENNPPQECLQTVQRLGRNLWERLPDDSDFLVTRLGVGRVPLCVEVKTRADVEGFRMGEEDELEGLSARIIEETRYVDNTPVCISLLKNQTVGLVGPETTLQYLLRAILVELATQQSFLDVHVVGLFEKEWMSHWGVLRWLPHIWDETMQTRYIAFDQKRRHMVCEMLSELIRSRTPQAEGEGKKRERPARPHFIVIAQNRDILFEENIYEPLVSNDPMLGITTLILADSMYDLPPSCQVLVEAGENNECCVYERHKYDERIYFKPDEPVHQKQLEEFFRRQAAIELQTKAGIAAIPSSVTFLQGYHAETVEDLQIRKRWEESKPYKSLAAPLGVMEGGKIFSLDIRSSEQAHGPHGLLAGTTGSGKSELLQSWILSMAVNFHPHDVNFVIIDYKGGGMSDLMEPLPHVVGKITNIDRNITRSLVSLKSELRRRQELFAKYSVNNIDKYQRAYDEGIAKERLPHLIIVTDEFAEMKKEEPEFMTELNSVATIGRSLGIHMLLATQKPAGVVTDQINSNSRFRICMKVQDVADSREMLKRADAARITQPGRAYVRVGEDEYFGLFQSFYSAAEYTGNTAGGMKMENQVRIVDVTGNRITVNKKKQKKKSTDIIDELTAVTKHINEICSQEGIEKLPGPWLPELPRWLPLESLGVAPAFNGEEWTGTQKGLSIPVGKYDVPERQKQGVQYMDFMAVGHFGIYGTPGSGKTTLLKTALTALGLYYKPDRVNVTVIDAANWSMSEFGGMPHVKEVILNQEEDKLARFIIRMRKEMEVRKNAFLKAAVSSLETYWESVSEDLPAIVIMVDHIEEIFEQYLELGDLLTDIATAGAAFGIYLVYTANSTIGIKYKFMQLVKGAITLQMADKGEYGSLVGPVAGVSLPQFPGRALMRGNPPVAFHAAIYMNEDSEQKRHDALETLFSKMREAVKRQKEKDTGKEGVSPVQEAIDMSASDIGKEAGQRLENEKDLKAGEMMRFPAGKADGETAGRACLYVGKDAQDLEPVTIDLKEHFLLAISSEEEPLREQMLKKTVDQLSRKESHQIIYLGPDNVKETRAFLEQILNDRRGSFKQHQKDPDFDKEEWMKGFTQLCLIVENPEVLVEKMDPGDLKSFRRIFTKSGEFGVLILVSAPRTLFTLAVPDILTDAVLSAAQVLALDGRPSDYVRGYSLSDPEAGTLLDENEIVWIRQDEMRLIRV